MYFISNRRIYSAKAGLEVFGNTPNTKGGNELRLLKVDKRAGAYHCELLSDQLTKAEKQQLKQRYKLPIACEDAWYASLRVACELFEQAQREQKNIVLFVHGYNNDVEDVYRTAREMERLYGVIVVPFSWPANGGGALSGTAGYLDDKKDARASTNALDSVIAKIGQYHDMLTHHLRKTAMTKAESRHPNNPQVAREYYMRLLEKNCRVKLTLACHSMGNYLLKYALQPSNSAASKLIFDNVLLIAADANNSDHERWVARIEARNRVYIIINEDDFALKWSRRKPGKEQLARLGHYLRNLSAPNCHYLNLTTARYVGTDHSYFKGTPVKKNAALRTLFQRAFCGEQAEGGLQFRDDINAYEL